MRTKLTCVTASGDEIEFGPFNQGVVVDMDRLIDIATREVILVRCSTGRWAGADAARRWALGSNPFRNVPRFYDRVFIQAVDETA